MENVNVRIIPSCMSENREREYIRIAIDSYNSGKILRNMKIVKEENGITTVIFYR